MTPTSDALQRIPDSDKDRPFQLRANKIFRSQTGKALQIQFFFFFFGRHGFPTIFELSIDCPNDTIDVEVVLFISLACIWRFH